MEINLLYAVPIVLLIIGLAFLAAYFLIHKKQPHDYIDYGNIIQKKTYTLFFDKEGYLKTTSSNSDQKNVMASLQIGQHISEYKKFNNMIKYFDTCKTSKKNLSLKLLEDRDVESARRHDLIFTPLIENDIVTGVFVISQEIVLKPGNSNSDEQKKELVEQRDYALKQIDEIEAQKSELELAFKKSSKHHIMLQKALRQIEIQKTDLEKALETINEQKMELEKANKEIRESSKMKEIFLANTSHEIRTPLNAIIGFTNLLLNDELGEAHRKYIENIKASGNNLLVVINDILDFSKIESGKLTLEQIEFNFKNLIQHTFNTLQVKSQEKSIDLRYDISPEIPDIIIGDPVRLNQILINLLGNSIKFTNSDGHVRMVATKGKSDEGYVKILFKVEDNGIGIPSEKLSQIFQSFTQAESDTTRKYGGTGLGLSIVKQLIELQSGEITVESIVGKGTTFTFYVILKPGTKQEEKHIKHQKKSVDSSLTDNMRILLVEDNIINQQLAFDTIKSWNNKINIELANNGKIAVEKLEKTDYDLILMDIQMPEMDGNEATQHIRQLDSPKSKTPIMAMTAHALKNEKENCLNNGMDDYISKPFDPEELFIKILSFAEKTTVTKDRSSNVEWNEVISEPSTKDKKEENPLEFKYFHVNNLVKIYQNNTEKIVKIVSMCYDSIPLELKEIENAYNNEKWDVLRNKAHSLKPKLGYLGMEDMQNNAKLIEINAQEESQRKSISLLINTIKSHWELASPELKQYIDS